jgi:hypothetical protein
MYRQYGVKPSAGVPGRYNFSFSLKKNKKRVFKKV